MTTYWIKHYSTVDVEGVKREYRSKRWWDVVKQDRKRFDYVQDYVENDS